MNVATVRRLQPSYRARPPLRHVVDRSRETRTVAAVFKGETRYRTAARQQAASLALQLTVCYPLRFFLSSSCFRGA
jgi:hypothetical protein